MKITRSIALAAALALPLAAPASADLMEAAGLIDENGTDISYKGPYAGAFTRTMAFNHWVPGALASDEGHMFFVEVPIDISEFATAAPPPAEPLLDHWEPGYWQDDDGYFRKLF